MRLPPLFIGAAAGVIAMLALAPTTGTVLGQLAKARAERATLAATLANPDARAPAVAPALAIPAANAATARAFILARIQRLATSGGVLVEETGNVQLPQGLAGLRIRLSGPERAVIALADAVERERPLMRWRRWQLVPIAGGGVRLTGEIVAAWR